LRKTAVSDEFDFDFEVSERDESRGSVMRRLLGVNPAARVGLAGLAALGLAVVANAVFLQDQRHAAPLFQTGLRNPAPLDQEVVALPPLPAPRPVEFAPTSQHQAKAPAVSKTEATRADPIGKAIAQIDQLPVSRVEKTKAVEPKPVERRGEDAIGGLIKGVVAAPPARAVEPEQSVAAAQRALMKLGFVVRPDGLFGGTTRQAIERFERDNKLPVRGELTARIKAELSRQSGVEIR
jgi:hypothetical protein